MSMICAMFGLLLISHVKSHGRLTSPVPRFGTGDNNGAENAPVTFASDEWICRHDGPVTPVTQEITPGNTFDLTWDFGAAHVGDCAVFISYDVNLPRAEQRWFKIGNLPKCKDQTGQTVSIVIPSWLPSGQIVVRWDWYALHQHPQVEFYTQCFDAMVLGNNGPQNALYTYKINNPDLYPSSANVAPGYRNAFNAGEQYMTGPPCALGFDQNNCAMTTCGTTGFVDPKALNGDGTYSCDNFDITDSGNNNNGDNGEAANVNVCQEENDTITAKNQAILGLSLTLVFLIIAFAAYVSFKEGWISLDSDESHFTAPKPLGPLPSHAASGTKSPPQHAVLPVTNVEWHYVDLSGKTIGPVSESILVEFARGLGTDKGSGVYVWNGKSVPEWEYIRNVPTLMKQIERRL